MAELILPDFVVYVAIVGWIVTQVLTMWGARWVIKRAQHESVKQKKEVVEHFTAELKLIREELNVSENPAAEGFQAEVQGLRQHLEDLDEALGGHFKSIHEVVEKLPERVRMAAISAKGVEMKSLYKGASEASEDIVEYVADTLDPMEIARAKIDSIEVKPDYAEKNPLGALIVEGGKAFLKAKFDESRGVVDMRRVGPRKGSGFG